MREINICHDLLLLTEQSEIIRHGDRIDKIIVFMDLHQRKLEETCNETPSFSIERLERIAAINATTLQAIAGVIANHLTFKGCVTDMEKKYEKYFTSNTSVPEFSHKVLTQLGPSPNGSDYATPTKNVTTKKTCHHQDHLPTTPANNQQRHQNARGKSANHRRTEEAVGRGERYRMKNHWKQTRTEAINSTQNHKGPK